MDNKEATSKQEALARSTDMTPVQGTVDVEVPISTLWEAFAHANWWPRWNRCFFWVYNRDLVPGRQLIWYFQPIRWWYLYKMFAVARIVEVEKERRVTWEVTALPGFYARHTYFMEDLGDGRSRFGSWEQAMGWGFRLLKRFWIAHFTFVKDRSLEGARRLEEVYRKEGKLSGETLKPRRYWPFWLVTLLLAASLAVGGWFYVAFLRLSPIEITPGVHAVLAGGGNSLIVQDGRDVLLVDTKFPPGSRWLKRWMAQHTGAPVTVVVDTHYHYDHTQGNVEYPQARILAHRAAPELMRLRDVDFWGQHPGGIPVAENLVDTTLTLKIGGQEVVLTHPGPAHTRGDLWVYLRRGGVEVVATGDMVFHTYYPFMDLGQGGIDIPGLIGSIRSLAGRYPHAVFLPGHGPLARADDLLRYADYLQFLYDSVEQARKRGLSEDETVAAVDLSRWDLSVLPSYHDGKLCWATAANNIRCVYRLQTHQADPEKTPCGLWR